MSLNDTSRREFLRRAAILSGSVGSAGLPVALNLAALGSAAAQTSGDYKAIVCLFLFGGNDSANMVLPIDGHNGAAAPTLGTSWAAYTTTRSQAPDPIALLAPGVAPNTAAAAASPAALGGVLPILPNFTTPDTDANSRNGARTFALHPSMSGVKTLFDAGRLAVIANAGPLVQPLTKVEYRSNTVPRPNKLFSHNDQQSTWQALRPEGATVGWGGRMGDLMASQNSSNTAFTNISVSGNAVFLAGQSVRQYQVGNGGAVAINGLAGNTFGSTTFAANLRSIITADSQPYFSKEHAAVVKRSVEAQAFFQASFAATTVAPPSQYTPPSSSPPTPATNNLAVSLQTVARIIKARSGLGVNRQVFFVSMGGFDTHDAQNRNHADLMARLSHALNYFDTELGVGVDDRSRVTLFTASDFGRTFTSNGDGTDHGWGAHHLVYGGAVLGKKIYGRFPTVGLNHDDEVGSGSFLPGISVDQIGGTLGKWFGVGDSDLDTIFPNLRNFSTRRDLGFLPT